jgi:hypothetical protein
MNASPQYKLSGLYLLDSIVKAGGKAGKESFKLRFSQNIDVTLKECLTCVPDDKVCLPFLSILLFFCPLQYFSIYDYYYILLYRKTFIK